MQHVAIDLGGRESQICVRSADGQILQERKLATTSLGPYLRRQPPSRVVLETCSEAFRVADFALDCGHEVRVVPATFGSQFGCGRKTYQDRPPRCSSAQRSFLPHRLAFGSRSHGFGTAAPEHVRYARGAAFVTDFAHQLRARLESHSAAQDSFGRYDDLRQTRTRSSTRFRQWSSEYVERQLKVIESLNEQIALADNELEQLAEQDPVCLRLMSVPGVGPVTSLRFVAALDARSRFPSAHTVQGFLGLTPGENSSSQRQQRTGITKVGPAPVRRALVQAAWNFRRLRPLDPISQWAMQIEKRRGKCIATVAVARKLAGVLYALWRDGSTYKPNHSAQRSA